MTNVATNEPSSIQTRQSLLNRLSTGDDTGSWQEFYRIYGKLARDFAIQAGLTDTEADEVVQETAIATARHLPAYRYDPKVCRFKTWLLNMTRWRIQDQLKKRKKESVETTGRPSESHNDETDRTATINRMPDPVAVNFDALFEKQWRESLFAAALDRVKTKFSLKHYQMFDLLVLKDWPAAEVAESLGVTLANVYVIRHRISAAIKKEMKRLEVQLEQTVNQTGRPKHTVSSE